MNQLLPEDWHGAIRGKTSHVFKNPGPSEVAKAMEENYKNAPDVRMMVDRGGLGDLYLWNSNESHTDFMNKFKKDLKGEAVPLYY